MGEGAGELLEGSEGSGCGPLSVELLRTDLSSLSLIFGGFFGWGKVLGNSWVGVRGVNADNFALELPRTDIFWLYLNFGGSLGWGRCWGTLGRE